MPIPPTWKTKNLTPSYVVLRDVFKETGRNIIAAALGLGRSTINKWCEEPPCDSNPDGSGAKNLLDRLDILLTTLSFRRPSDAQKIVNWINQLAKAIINPAALAHMNIEDTFKTIRDLNKKTHELMDHYISAAEDGKFDEFEIEKLEKVSSELTAYLQLLIITLRAKRGEGRS